MVTLEARAYGLARHIRQRDALSVDDRQRRGRLHRPGGLHAPREQLERACLEDTVMAKLHGLTMGLDVCATFHMGIAPAALRR